MLAYPSADILVSWKTLAGILLCQRPLPALCSVGECEVFPTPLSAGIWLIGPDSPNIGILLGGKEAIIYSSVIVGL